MYGRCRLVLLIVGLSIAPTIFQSPSIGAQSQSASWLGSEPPRLTLVKNVPIDQVPLNSPSDCLPSTTIATIPKRIQSLQNEVTVAGCAVQTAYGQQLVENGYVRLNDTGLAGPIKNSAGGTVTTFPINGSRHIIQSSYGYEGLYLSVIKDFVQNSKVSVSSNGSLTHRLNSSVVPTPIKNPQGNMIDFTSMRFSANGAWMVGDVPWRGMTRVNIDTGETLNFTGGYNYSNGLRPKFISATSSDGRYVLAAEYTYSVLKLYDLSTCTPNADPTKPANCQSRDLLPFVSSQVSNYRGVQHASFSTNYTLRLHIQTVRAGGQLETGLYSLLAPGENESSLD